MKPEFNYYPLNIQPLEGTTTSNIISSGAGSVMAAGYLQSPNYVVGSSGWKIGADGNVEFDSGTFRGTITASTGTIGGWSINATSLYTGTEDHSGYTANAGDITIYSDGTNASIHAYNFYIDADGKFYSTAGALSGVSITTVPNDANTDISLLSFTHTMVFSATDNDTVAWTAGTITMSNGRTFSISAGNTANITALNWIYLDTAVSSTVLQKTPTAATAMGANKIILGIAENNADASANATFVVNGGTAGLSITASNIKTSILSAITADLGTITAGTVTGATIRTASSGTRFTMDSTSFQGINSSGIVIFEVILTGADEGDVILGDDASPTYAKWDDSEGILLVNGYALASDIEYATGSVEIKAADTERTTSATSYTKLKDISVVKNGTLSVNFEGKGTRTTTTENLTGFTEEDAGGYLAETATRCTFTALTSNADTYLYKDYTASYFSGDFTHDFELYINSGGVSETNVYPYTMSNDLDDITGLYNADKSYYTVTVRTQTNAFDLYLSEVDSGTDYNDMTTLNRNTLYYIRIKRNETVGTYGTIYLYVYTSSADRTANTNIIDTLTVTLHTSKKDFRYIMLCASENIGSSSVKSGYVENLLLVASLSNTDCYAKIYVDGVTTGTERDLTTSYTNYAENISVSKNCNVQLYAKSPSGGVAAIQNFKLKSNAYEVSTVITD